LEVRRERRQFDVRGFLYPLRHDSDSDQSITLSHEITYSPALLAAVFKTLACIFSIRPAFIAAILKKKKTPRPILASWLINNGGESYMVEMPCRR
jgi:hypothetical protein